MTTGCAVRACYTHPREIFFSVVRSLGIVDQNVFTSPNVIRNMAPPPQRQFDNFSWHSADHVTMQPIFGAKIHLAAVALCNYFLGET